VKNSGFSSYHRREEKGGREGEGSVAEDYYEDIASHLLLPSQERGRETKRKRLISDRFLALYNLSQREKGGRGEISKAKPRPIASGTRFLSFRKKKGEEKGRRREPRNSKWKERA